MKLTPARFIQSYNAIGVRFTLQAGVVVSQGASPAFAEWVMKRSEWLAPWLHVQAEREPVAQPVVQVESTHADRLVWDGMQNARRAEERRAETIERAKVKRWKVRA